MALLRVLMFGLLTFTEVFTVMKVLGGMAEVLPIVKVFHQFTLPLIPYHRDAVTRHKLLLLGQPVEHVSC